MSELRYGIDFGAGGLIRDEETLEKLRKQPQLLPTDILKLARFYRGYQTNRALADHLVLVALTDIVGDPDKKLQESIHASLIKTAAAAKRTLTADDADYEDLLEQLFVNDEGPNDTIDFLFLKLYPVTAGLNLLVEATEKQERFYVIGVSPDLDKLPQPKKRTSKTQRKA